MLKNVWRSIPKGINIPYFYISSRTADPQCSMVVIASCINAAFLQPGLGLFIKVEWIIKSYNYQSIQVHRLQVSATKLYMKRNFTFQHSNDPKHTSKSRKEWLNHMRNNVFEWVRAQIWITLKIYGVTISISMKVLDQIYTSVTLYIQDLVLKHV